ncbi:VWA domain-containing protein [Candidatus Saccharibacteria bacterium]|nr:VWA domain-containing protein [Candidatus Saccharibacteria bacterium]
MQPIFSNLSNRKLLIITGIVTAALLIGVIIITVIVLTSASENKQTAKSPITDSNTSGSGSSFKGNSSDLSGTVSRPNLTGLSLRINQVETCNPSVISAYVAVTNGDGAVTKGLVKDDVKVYLDGGEVKNFSFNSVDTKAQPITNALAIDHSGSMRGAAMENAKSAAISYVAKLKTGDQVSVTQFDNLIETLMAASTDKTTATRVISGIQPRGDTAVYDAIIAGLGTVPDCGRKALTVLTDGTDTASKNYSESSVISEINKSNLPVFAVGVVGSQFNPASIRKIAESTGGQYFEANTPSEIAGLYDKINNQLTGQFVANLKLSLKKDGSVHRLKIISSVEGSDTSSERSFVY